MLYYGSEYLINKATVLAKKFNISSIIIGVTIIALGTSLPELIVSIKASIYNNTQLVIGNILGSNNEKIDLVLGAVMLIDVFEVKQNKKFISNLYFLIAITFIFSFFLTTDNLTQSNGIILMASFFLYMIFTYMKLNDEMFFRNESEIFIPSIIIF